jgi:hypothetical protein
MTSSDAHHKKRERQIREAVVKMTPKQIRMCSQLQIPPQDYVIVMNKIHI